MSYQVLARKWRPRSFRQLIGQDHVVQALVNGLDRNRVHHAFLFTGTRGVGKTTIARILAKCLNCERGMSSTPCGECSSCVDIDEGRFVDMLEIDAASRTKVDDTRDLLESVQYTPSRGRYKVYIIDEVHMLSNSSFNALLKTLEEPPEHVKFVLATTDPERIPVTILSRCLQFNLRRLYPEQIRASLETIVEAEGFEAEPEALVSLSRAADGSMRDGLSLLDQAIAFGGGSLSAHEVAEMLGTVAHGQIVELVSALAAGDPAALLATVGELVRQSRDLDRVLTGLAETLHRICLLQCAPGYRDAERSDWEAIEALATRLAAEDAQLYYQIAIKAREELVMAPDPRTGLEMALLRMLAFRPAGMEASAPPVPSASGGADNKSRSGTSSPAKAARATSGTRLSSGPQETQTMPRRVSEPEAAPSLPEAAAAAAEGDWISLARQLKLSGQARELARHVHLKARTDHEWDFIISHSLRHLGSPGCVDRLGKAIAEHVGHPVRVRLVDSEDAIFPTTARLEEQELHRRMTDAERSIDEDPVVKTLKERFGARIVEDSIQPLQ